MRSDYENGSGATDMNHSKRHRAILTLLHQDGTVTIADLAQKLDVSLETVRRDI